MARHLQTLSLVTLLALGLSACHKPEARETEAQRARAVNVVTVANRPIEGSLTAAGSLVAREEAAASAEISGYRVAQVLVDQGAWVRQGQPLARLDGALLSAQVEQARALAAQSAINAEQAEAQAARVLGLDGQGVLSQEQLDNRRFQARAARATADAQAASFRDAQTRSGKLLVTAPVGGLVLERNVRPGDTSQAGAATPWFRIAQGGEVELEAELTEEDLSRIRPGQSATVTLPTGTSVQGRVRLVSPKVSAQTKLGTVRIRLPVRADIRVGGYGRAQFSDASGQALSVPETAVRYDADGASVMVVGNDNRVRKVIVQTGARGSGLVALVKGPPAGARVVRTAAAFLLDGDMVRPVDGNAPAAKVASK